MALEIASFLLIFQSNAYQRNIMISSANVITGHISAVSAYIMSYLNLREVNRDLTERNGQLEMRILALQDQLEMMQADSTLFTGYALPDSFEEGFPYDFRMARVVNKSVVRLNNYITINKGSADGIQPDMGVVSERGVVGIVLNSSSDFSVVLPLLNTKMGLSCKVLGSNYTGSLHWNGRDPRYGQLEELPRHVEFHEGDTIVTSGYSAVFPEGIMVGTISGFERQRDDNFYSLEVELATNFYSLDNVRVITNFSQEEQKQVEQKAQK